MQNQTDVSKLENEVKELKTKLNQIQNKKTDCRDVHLKLHAPVSDKRYCEYCESYVAVQDRNICVCCFHIVPKKKNNILMNSILNEAVRQYRKEIAEWVAFPITSKQMKTYSINTKLSTEDKKKLQQTSPYNRISFRHVVYEIPIKFLGLSQELLDKERMLIILKNKTAIKGFTLEDKNSLK